MKATIQSQQGATLLVALMMLVLMSLLALSALNTGTTNLRVVGNMQARSEALGAAQQTIETVLSTPTFISSPANAVINPCETANTICTDINGDGTQDYTTRLTPQPACVFVRSIKVQELDINNTEDLGCATGQAQQFGVAGGASSDSLCSNTVWEITAETTGIGSGAKVTVTQGIGVRVSSDDALSACL